MDTTTQVQQGQGFYWDKRGRVTATWVERDLSKLKRWMAQDKPEQKIAELKQRIADQCAAYIAKLSTKRVFRKTLEHFGRLTVEFDAIAGTDYTVQLATVAASKLAQRKPLPWDIHGRVVPQWMRKAAQNVKRQHARLAQAERELAASSGQAAIRAKVARRRQSVLAAEARLTEMVEHGAASVSDNAGNHAPETVKTIKHIHSQVEVVKATSALAAGSSFNQERYEGLEKLLKSALLSLPAKKGFLRERDDAIQQGRLGIHHAAEMWDVGHSRRAKFTSYAPLWIGRFMECRTDDHVASDKHRKGAPQKFALYAHEYDDVHADSWHPAASDNTERTAIVNLMLEQLTPIERTVVERTVMKSEKIVDVSRSMGLGADMIRRIRDAALARLAR